MAKKKRTIKRNVGYYLRVFRAAKDLTQADAAALIGVVPSYWSLLEDGKRHASPKVAVKLSNLTGAPLELLLGLRRTA